MLRLEELAGRRPVRVQNSSVVAQGYTVVKELGRGGQGTMYLCTKRSWFRTRLEVEGINKYR